MAQWITRLPTEQKIAGSSPAEIVTLLVGVSIFNHFVNKKMELFETSTTSGNRTRAARVAGEHSTTEPTLHWWVSGGLARQVESCQMPALC